MAEMLLGDQQCIGWSRHKWSQKVNCSEWQYSSGDLGEMMLMRDAGKIEAKGLTKMTGCLTAQEKLEIAKALQMQGFFIFSWG